MTKEKDGAAKSLREIALSVITEITSEGNFSHKVISRTLNSYQRLEKQERAFISRLCEGTIERLITLDFIINCYSNTKVNKMKPLIRNLLRMSVYQLKYMDSIPESAVCNEAVKIAKKRGFQNLSGFVNGILRNIVRNPEKAQIPEDDFSIKYSVPKWLVDELIHQYDKDTVAAILNASLKEKETTIRCNLNKMKVNELSKVLEDEHIRVRPGNYLPYALKISNYNYLNQLDSFNQGLFNVQDESSMLVGAISGVNKDNYVIDVCAAPGGKSLHIASLLNGSGHVSSRDVSGYKLTLIEDNVKRLGLNNVSVKLKDALILEEDDIEKADLLIADLPCSGLGVISKKPDIKYNMTKEKLDSLVLLQRDILKVVSQYVKPGGTLIYSTCTINKEENINNVLWFIHHFDFELEALDDYLPDNLKDDSTKKGYLQLLPGIHDSDGFFIARLKKKL